MAMKLSQDFYTRKNVVLIAKELLGKQLITKIEGTLSAGIIVETEAYSWKERGCHAYDGRMTNRNKVMFEPGGHAYVYLCYGIHNLFNVVTNNAGVAEAVLIRAIEPTRGVDAMIHRRGIVRNTNQLTSGPGKLTKALGINRDLNGKFLLNSEIWIEDVKYPLHRKEIQASPRIGIDYAGTDAKLPWRFYIKENKWVSKF
jgi:DNA-3-methyladenine glycosylase